MFACISRGKFIDTAAKVGTKIVWTNNSYIVVCVFNTFDMNGLLSLPEVCGFQSVCS